MNLCDFIHVVIAGMVFLMGGVLFSLWTCKRNAHNLSERLNVIACERNECKLALMNRIRELEDKHSAMQSTVDQYGREVDNLGTQMTSIRKGLRFSNKVSTKQQNTADDGR
jgi:hypothetical protein